MASRTFRRTSAALAALVTTAATALATTALGTAAAAPTAAAGPGVKVIVRGTHASESTVRALGGHVTRELSLIGGYAATVPAGRVAELAHSRGVASVTPDTSTTVDIAPAGQPDPDTRPSVYRSVTRADALGRYGDNGQGVTIALIDTGVTSSPDVAGALVPITVNPLSGTTQYCVNLTTDPDCTDHFGHGTFMAGLMVGNGASSSGQYVGEAPQARLLSVKVAGADGSCDVSTIIAAIQWVVLNAQAYNVRVLNLSLGTDSTQPYSLDPLDFAVEKAWQAGIVVDVAASNNGPAARTIDDPANDPFVITVGATDDMGTKALGDDQLPSFSSRGPTASDGLAKPDVVAPGAHLVSLDSPGSTIATDFPSGMPAPYRRGSGTSMANAVVSGLVADLLSANPTLTPNRVKYMLTSTASPDAASDPMAVGAGLVNGQAALTAGPGLANVGVSPSLGTGSLAAARGTVSVTLQGTTGTVLDSTTNLTAFGTVADFTSGSWWGGNWTGGNWTGGNWTGGNWTGGNWTGGNWTGGNWTGGNWTGGNWTGGNWTGGNWTGGNWTDASWQGTDEPQPNGYGGILTGSAWYGAWDR